jgi:hypothetical protein
MKASFHYDKGKIQRAVQEIAEAEDLRVLGEMEAVLVAGSNPEDLPRIAQDETHGGRRLAKQILEKGLESVEGPLAMLAKEAIKKSA